MRSIYSQFQARFSRCVAVLIGMILVSAFATEATAKFSDIGYLLYYYSSSDSQSDWTLSSDKYELVSPMLDFSETEFPNLYGIHTNNNDCLDVDIYVSYDGTSYEKLACADSYDNIQYGSTYRHKLSLNNGIPLSKDLKRIKLIRVC